MARTKETTMPMPRVVLASDAGPGADERRAANLAAVESFFDCMRRKDLDAWIALWADDAELLVPYPPQGAGFPPSIEGRDTLLGSFRDLFSHFSLFDADVRTVYPTLDPDILIVEWSVEAHLVEGPVYRGDPITVFRFAGGKLRHYHDYFNPELFRVVVEALAPAAV